MKALTVALHVGDVALSGALDVGIPALVPVIAFSHTCLTTG